MIALALAEWKLWKRLYLRASLAASLIVLVPACLLPRLRLFMLCASAGLFFPVLGWHYGNRWQAGSSFSRLASGRSAREILGGRSLAALGVGALHLVLAAPPLLLALAALAREPWLLAAFGLAWLAAFALAAGLGFLSSLLFGATEALLGAYVLGAWLLAGLAWKPALAANPLSQVWDLAGGAPLSRFLLPLVGEFLLASAAAALAAKLARRREGGHPVARD